MVDPEAFTQEWSTYVAKGKSHRYGLCFTWDISNIDNYEDYVMLPALAGPELSLIHIFGIFCNVLLFLIKISIGFVLRSISVMADAFNNLSDAGSSIISFVGVRIASKPADKDHPFGHGRIEYISALVVSFLVIEVGFTFLKDAIQKIKHPQEMHFQLISVIILLLSVGIKLWLGMFNKKLGKRIHSQVMLATAADSIGDVITTSATILSLIVFGVTGINIDGFVGLGVSLLSLIHIYSWPGLVE